MSRLTRPPQCPHESKTSRRLTSISATGNRLHFRQAVYGAALGAERVTGTVTDIAGVLIREVGEHETIIMGDSCSAAPGTC